MSELAALLTGPATTERLGHHGTARPPRNGSATTERPGQLRDTFEEIPVINALTGHTTACEELLGATVAA